MLPRGGATGTAHTEPAFVRRMRHKKLKRGFVLERRVQEEQLLRRGGRSHKLWVGIARVAVRLAQPKALEQHTDKTFHTEYVSRRSINKNSPPISVGGAHPSKTEKESNIKAHTYLTLSIHDTSIPPGVLSTQQKTLSPEITSSKLGNPTVVY